MKFPFQQRKQKVRFSKEGLSVSDYYMKWSNLVHNTTENNEIVSLACSSENATNKILKKKHNKEVFPFSMHFCVHLWMRA